MEPEKEDDSLKVCLLEELTLEAHSLPAGGEGDRRKMEGEPPGGETDAGCAGC